MSNTIIKLVILCTFMIGDISGHGRMNDPPGRSTMWRMGFDNPPNYNDMEVYCGGLTRLWDTNGGRCGVCGDAYDLPEPRDNEAGGLYGNGIIVKNYQQGQAMLVKIQLTANHGGYFEFRICPTNNPTVRATEECMNNYVLRTSQGFQYPVEANKYDYEFPVYLPSTLSCSQCVFRWKYYAAQNTGFGDRQEHFYSCADISIQKSNGISITNAPATTTRKPYVPITTTKRPYIPITTTKRPYIPITTTKRPYIPVTNRPYIPITTTRIPHVDTRPKCDSICVWYCRNPDSRLCPPLCKNCRLV